MASYLGLYIEDNIIKYAKVSKVKEEFKIDTFGIKFYSNIKEAINQIVQETNSLKIPISVNLVNENYQYFSMFSQLSKNDLDKAIKMEFESYCTEKGYNPNFLETRYAVSDDPTTPEKIKVINISENTVELDKIKGNFEGLKLSNIVPVSMSIPNIADLNPKENSIIVNLEGKTTVTTMHGNCVFDIQTFDEGSTMILSNIIQKENSYAKAYDVLRNTTIYTSEETVTANFDDDEQAKYLEEILPVLYTVLNNVQKIVASSLEKIDKIYITGTLSCINNIDLYFQEYFGDSARCEILKPSIITNNQKDVNIKEYIEVNSAISLAIQGLGQGIKGISFKQDLLKMDLKDLFKAKPTTVKRKTKINKEFFKFDKKVTTSETWVLRACVVMIIFIFAYIVFSKILLGQIEEKKKETQNAITSIKNEISQVSKDTTTLNNKLTEYSTLIKQLNEINGKISDVTANKYLIPNLLEQIARSIDESVQITSISNPYDKHIVIQAQSSQYQGLGYFKTKLQINNILTNVVAGGSMKQGNLITVTIEGDLP